MQDYDPYADLICSNQEAISRVKDEALRRIRKAAEKGDCALILRILDAVNTYHPMHEESWSGFPEELP